LHDILNKPVFLMDAAELAAHTESTRLRLAKLIGLFVILDDREVESDNVTYNLSIKGSKQVDTWVLIKPESEYASTITIDALGTIYKGTKRSHIGAFDLEDMELMITSITGIIKQTSTHAGYIAALVS